MASSQKMVRTHGAMEENTMNEYKKIIACFKEMGFRPTVDEFEDRLRVQKIVYLLQLKGINTNFQYGLHIRGPYSHPLADELYKHRNEFEKLTTDIKLKKDESEAVHKLHDLFDIQSGLLEVAATYAYFIIQEKRTPIESIKEVKRLKASLSETKIALGISKAKEYLFPPTEKELKELREEMAPWQNAAVYS